MTRFSIKNIDRRHTTKQLTKNGPKKVHEERMARYRSHLKTFTATLHNLDIDVEEHLELFEVSENDISRMKDRLAGFDINDAEREKLKKIFEDILFVVDNLLLMERNLWTNIKPWVREAEVIRVNMSHPSSLDIVKLFSKKLHKNQKSKLNNQISAMRNRLLSSINLEHKTFFKTYPQILEQTESLTRDLVKLENKWRKKKIEIPQVFIDINDIVREIIHEDIAEVSKDVFHMYKLRSQAYTAMIDTASKSKPGLVEKLKEERKKITAVGKIYITLHDDHHDKLLELYSQLGGN